MLKIYAYKNCDTCRKAIKWLSGRKIKHEILAIRETPPTLTELRIMLQAQGELRKLFNTSGRDYKELGLKDKFPKLSEAEALTLLVSNGNLVKRPFVLGKNMALLGFKQGEWEEIFN